MLWSRRPNEPSLHCLSGESRSAKSCHLAIQIMHVTLVHRALRDYAGSQMAMAWTDVEGLGKMMTVNGDSCTFWLNRREAVDELSAGASADWDLRAGDLAVALDGEPTPFVLNCVAA
jgi:hypothetical protein